MGLEEALEALVASEPFERLLLARERPSWRTPRPARRVPPASPSRSTPDPPCAGPAGGGGARRRDRRVPRGERVALLPAWEALPYEGISPAPEVAARRADAVHRLRAAKGPFVVVAPALAAMQGLIPRSALARPRAGRRRRAAPDALAERLVDLGYARADLVEHRGEFAVRGGVVDVFPATPGVRCVWSTAATRSSRSASSRPRRSCRRPRSRASWSGQRELIPDEELRAPRDAGPQLHADRFGDLLQRIADGLSRGHGDARAARLRPPPDAGRAPARRGRGSS